MSHLGRDCTLTRNTLLLWRLANGNVWKSGSLRKLTDIESSSVAHILKKTNKKKTVKLTELQNIIYSKIIKFAL